MWYWYIALKGSRPKISVVHSQLSTWLSCKIKQFLNIIYSLMVQHRLVLPQQVACDCIGNLIEYNPVVVHRSLTLSGITSRIHDIRSANNLLDRQEIINEPSKQKIECYSRRYNFITSDLLQMFAGMISSTNKVNRI